MNAKEFLSQAFYLEQRIQSKMEQIESLRALATRVTQVFGGEPVSRGQNATGARDTVLRILEAEEELNRQIDDLVELKMKIARVIELVEDVQLRLILEKRYLSFMSWEEIAADMGFSARWLQVRHLEALEAVEKVMEREEP